MTKNPEYATVKYFLFWRGTQNVRFSGFYSAPRCAIVVLINLTSWPHIMWFKWVVSAWQRLTWQNKRRSVGWSLMVMSHVLWRIWADTTRSASSEHAIIVIIITIVYLSLSHTTIYTHNRTTRCHAGHHCTTEHTRSSAVAQKVRHASVWQVATIWPKMTWLDSAQRT